MGVPGYGAPWKPTIRVRGVPPENVAKVEVYYWRLYGHTSGRNPEREAFSGMLMDIVPTSCEIRVPKDQIVRVLLRGTGLKLPKKYGHLLADKTIGPCGER